MQGYVQVYTGDGKGKTTAALGLALRAAGAGLKVFIGQFIKSAPYCEIKALERFADRISVRQFGRGCFTTGNPYKKNQERSEPVDTRIRYRCFRTPARLQDPVNIAGPWS
jgi:ATP:corrinoid adenosyltransferase